MYVEVNEFKNRVVLKAHLNHMKAILKLYYLVILPFH